jgi:hypothetical protein
MTLPVERVATAMRRLGHEHVDLLKLDIEGAEYDVIDDVLRDRLAIRQILVEFHDRFEGIEAVRTARTVESLLDNGYVLFNIEDDNYSFIRP